MMPRIGSTTNINQQENVTYQTPPHSEWIAQTLAEGQVEAVVVFLIFVTQKGNLLVVKRWKMTLCYIDFGYLEVGEIS